MNSLALIARMVTHDRGRTILSALAIAAAVVLVIVIEGFQVGLYRQVREYPNTLDVPLVATQTGVSNMTGARSIVPLDAVASVAAVDGVSAAHPIVGVPLVYARGADKTPIYVVAYQDKGGPTQLSSGHAIANQREVVIDRGLARKYGLAPGDTMALAGFEFEIAGISAGSSNVFNPFVFVRLDDALALYAGLDDNMGHGAGVSFVLIDVEPGRNVEHVRNAIESSVPTVDVLTPAELGANDEAMARQLLGGVILLLVVVAYVIGVLVIGLTLYASAFERRRTLGMMKALGATNRALYRNILIEALLLVLLSLIVGLIASRGVAELIGLLAPQYLVVPWSGEVVLKTALATLGMAAFASFLPVRQVANVDPAIVFKR